MQGNLLELPILDAGSVLLLFGSDSTCECWSESSSELSSDSSSDPCNFLCSQSVIMTSNDTGYIAQGARFTSCDLDPHNVDMQLDIHKSVVSVY